MSQVRVALVGVGNCASSLVQGVDFYGHGHDIGEVPGLMHQTVDGYDISDIAFVAAFDVNETKVGEPLRRAIFAEPNCTVRFEPEERWAKRIVMGDPTVQRGRTLDGLGTQLSKVIRKAPGPSCDVVKVLRDAGADVVVNFLPVGSEEATKYYAEHAILADCAFVNAMPVFIASDPTGYWPRQFERAGLPVIGDDVKSQVGATIVHRVLTHLFEQRGVRLDRTYQLNFGGNTDFLNMKDLDRLESKKVSKTQSVQSQLEMDLPARDIHVGPSDHVPWLDDRKWCYIRMEGTTFGEVPLNLELKLEVVDSPNSAGIIVDAVRYAKVALDRGIAGPLVGPSSWLMKSPPQQFTDEEARELCELFIDGLGPDGHPPRRGTA